MGLTREIVVKMGVTREVVVKMGVTSEIVVLRRKGEIDVERMNWENVDKKGMEWTILFVV